MASPAVAATNKSSTNNAGTTHTVNLPAFTGGSAANDIGQLLLVVLDKGSTAATINALAGWNELLDENSGNGLYVAWRKVDGTEGSTITLTSSASTRSAEITFRISGAADPAVTPPTVGTTSSGTSATPDPPASSTPPSSKDYLFIAIAGMAGEEADDDTWGNTPPTNYLPSPPLQKACGTAGTNLGGLILAASRQLTTGSAQDPGTFGVDVSAAWRAQTLLVHPADPTTVNGGVASEADSVPAGQVRQTYTASPAAEADSAPGGAVLQVQLVQGGVASETDSAAGGTVIQPQVVAGGVASEVDATPAGQVLQIYVGSPATESDSAPGGSVGQVYTASPAAESDSVPAGRVLQVYTASPATEGDSAPAGLVAQIYTAAPALETDSAPAGSVEQGSGGQTIFGGVASEVDAAAAGIVAQIYTSAPAIEVDTVPAGEVPQIFSDGIGGAFTAPHLGRVARPTTGRAA